MLYGKNWSIYQKINLHFRHEQFIMSNEELYALTELHREMRIRKRDAIAIFRQAVSRDDGQAPDLLKKRKSKK